MAELDQDGWYECAVCGRRRSAADRCGCATDGDGQGPALPAGWNPGLTAGGGRRLPLMGRPAAEPDGEGADGAAG